MNLSNFTMFGNETYFISTGQTHITDLELINSFCTVLNSMLINIIVIICCLYFMIEMINFISNNYYDKLRETYYKILIFPFFILLVIINISKFDYIIDYYLIVKNIIIILLIGIILYLLYKYKDYIRTYILKNGKV